MRDIPGPTPGQEVTTPSSAGEAAAASADTSSHSTRHFACDLTMHSASLIPLSDQSVGCMLARAAWRVAVESSQPMQYACANQLGHCARIARNRSTGD